MSDDRAHYAFVYSCRLAPGDQIEAHIIPVADSPVKLSLSLPDHQGLKGFREIRQQAAILDIHMTKERVIDLFAKLRDLARSMDWPLSSEDEFQV